MKQTLKVACLVTSLVMCGALVAAEPPANTAEPAVVTSPAAAAPGRAAPSTAAAPATAPAATPAAGTSPVPATAPAAAGASPPGNRANADRIELGATQITGNAELPRVMYVVPWKRAELGDLAGRPAKSLLDEVLTPIDRDVFRRQNRYYEALQPDTGGTAPEGEK